MIAITGSDLVDKTRAADTMSLLQAMIPLFDADMLAGLSRPFEVSPFRLGRDASSDKSVGGQRAMVPSYDKRELSRFGATDVIEKEDSLVFEVDAPGCSKDDFNIEVSPDNVLTISGERRTQSSGEDNDDGKGRERESVKRRWNERSFASFTRSFQLPPGAQQNITATVDNGVLKVTVPVEDESKPKSITIAVNDAKATKAKVNKK